MSKPMCRPGEARRNRARPLIAVAAVLVAGTIIARRLGYGVGGETVVRCRDGHLFTTLWIPGVSIKSVRLGWRRFQFCPVARHWTLVTPVRAEDLTNEEREAAGRVHDVRIP